MRARSRCATSRGIVMTPMTADGMNSRLRSTYEAALRQLEQSWHPENGDSRPMLISVHPDYSALQAKFLVVGQEAGGWAESIPMGAGAANRLMDFYTDFKLGRHQRSTPFWQGARYLNTKLNPNATSEAFLWSNLVKVDVQRRRPTATVEVVLASLRLLEREMEITAPDAVVFFTGPRYDGRLKATFPQVSFEDLGGGTARITGLGCTAVRTYHPRYLRLSKTFDLELDKAFAVLTEAGHT